jgi:hypothetical protein
MKTFYLTFALLFILPSFLLAEEESNFSGEISTTVASDYMFRGFALDEGASIQPAANLYYDSADYGVWGVGVWSHISAEHPSDEYTYTEVDYEVNWSKEYGDFSLVLGHFWYTYPHSRGGSIPSTNEFYASLGYNTFLSPILTVYHDYKIFDTQYYELVFSHELTSDHLGEGFNLTPYLSFGFGSNTEKVYEDDGLVVVATGLNSYLSLGDIGVTPGLHYSFKVDDATINRFWFDLNFSYSF